MKQSGSITLIVCALGLALPACQATPSQNRVDGQTTPRADDARVAMLEKRVVDLDERLRKIEDLIRQASGEDLEPDPAAVYSVPVDGLPYVGPKYAKVTLVTAYEFACPYCAQVAPTIKTLVSRYKSDLKVVYAPFIVHADVAVPPALAVCAANAQGKFAEMESVIWQKGWGERDLSVEKMAALAREIGLDMKRYEKDISSEACMNSIKTSARNLSQVGTTGTPTFYINGRFLIGAQTLEAFAAVIDEELARASAAIAGGISLADYYQKAVVEGGKNRL